MVEEMIQYLKPEAGKVYADCTFGAGGYSRRILSANKGITLYAFDLDPEAQDYVKDIQAEKGGSEIFFTNGNFKDIKELLALKNVFALDGIVADLGVSSMQIDNEERGFSFQKDGPLDMRMSKNGESASDFVNTAKKEELALVIKNYGDEPKARQIASAIVRSRDEAPIETTLQLAQIVHGVYGRSKVNKIDSATKTFQAIRIKVNEELENLQKLLQSAKELLKEGGRLVVICFHSLEDGIVKQFLKRESQQSVSKSRYLPDLDEEKVVQAFKVITRKPATPSKEEINKNIRARSARLRAAERINV